MDTFLEYVSSAVGNCSSLCIIYFLFFHDVPYDKFAYLQVYAAGCLTKQIWKNYF